MTHLRLLHADFSPKIPNVFSNKKFLDEAANLERDSEELARIRHMLAVNFGNSEGCHNRCPFAVSVDVRKSTGEILIEVLCHLMSFVPQPNQNNISQDREKE